MKRRGARKLAFELLERRTLLAIGDVLTGAGEGDGAQPDTGDVTADVAPDAVSDPAVGLTLELTDVDGAPLETLVVGQPFVLHVFAQDLRAVPQGVYAAYLDIEWDSAKANVIGGLQFSALYCNGRSGDTVVAGTLDEAGSFSASMEEVGGGALEVFSVLMQATGVGDLQFTTNPADEAKSHDVLMYGENGRIDPDRITYGSATVAILAADPPGPETPPSPPPSDPGNPPADEPIAEVRLEVVDSTGQPVSSVHVGDQFELRGLLVMLAGQQQPFAAFTDVKFDDDLLLVLEDSPEFGAQTGTAGPGNLSEAGRIMYQPDGSSSDVIFRKNFLATGDGDIDFSSDAADFFGDDILLVGQNDAVPLSQVIFGHATLTILP
jgi:hypothetical protein